MRKTILIFSIIANLVFAAFCCYGVVRTKQAAKKLPSFEKCIVLARRLESDPSIRNRLDLHQLSTHLLIKSLDTNIQAVGAVNFLVLCGLVLGIWNPICFVIWAFFSEKPTNVSSFPS